jgi:2',3'-cyclic-nucleotide 2'-phosphodiesterase (5'-nucleotidase family)
VDSKLNECTPSSDFIQTWPNCTGGMANRALFIRQKIASNPNTLVLDGGSAFWGSYIRTILQYPFLVATRPTPYFSFLSVQSTASPYYMADLMSLLASHAIAISEADLFNGPEQLGQYIRRVLFQSQVNDHLPAFLASNIDASLEPKLTGLISPYTIITVGSLKVGVFSMIDPMSAYQTSPGPNVYFNTMSGNVNITVPSGLIINNTVAALLTSNCGMIIMMTNVQVDRIKSLWPYPPRIDLILTTAYFNSFVPVTISGYPHVWTTLQSSQITIAGIREIHGSSIVNLTLSFTGNTISLNSIAASLTPLTPQISTNTTFLQAAGYSIGYYADSLQSIHTYIGYTKVAISGLTGSWDSQDCRYTDCQVGRLVTDSLLRWCASCDVAVINAGSIVGSFSAGNISLNQLSQVFAHNDKVSYFSVYGKTLLAALRNMAAQGVGRGSFLQVGGMRFAWNPNMTSTPNLAILEVEVWDRSKSVYSTLKLDQLYKVATTMFYRTGGDDYTMFMDSKQVFNPVDSGPDTQSLVYKYLNESYLFPAFVPVVEPATLQSCYTNASYPLKTKAGGCRIVATSGSIDLSLQCPSNPTVCYSQVSEFGDGVPSTLEGIVANAAMCGRCSGMGQCADQKCTCQQPTTTIFAGLSMVSGADCGIVRRATLLVPAYSGLVYFLGIAGIAIGLMIGFALIVFRNHPAIASTSPIFGVITSIGTCLASAAVIVLSQRVTDSLCQWWLWFTALGFSLAFTPIIVRTYRIHMIFNSNTGSAVIISNLQLGLIIFAVIALDLGVLLWWFFTAPYKAAGMLLPDANSAMIVCGSTSIGTLGFALFGLKAFLLFACVYYAYSVRNVEGNWNESHTIAATIYNATAAFAILLPVRISRYQLVEYFSNSILILSLFADHLFCASFQPAVVCVADCSDDDICRCVYRSWQLHY